jgi:glyoxalase family protein
MQLTGIRHMTAISAKPRENLSFYTGLFGTPSAPGAVG